MSGKQIFKVKEWLENKDHQFREWPLHSGVFERIKDGLLCVSGSRVFFSGTEVRILDFKPDMIHVGIKFGKWEYGQINTSHQYMIRQINELEIPFIKSQAG